MPKKTYTVTLENGKEYDVDVDEVRPLEPTPMAEFFKTAGEAATGYAKGFLPGAGHAVLQTLPAIVGALWGAGKGMVHLAQDPVGTLTDAKAAVQGMPGKTMEMVDAALDLARRDPEAFGRQVGEFTGGTTAMLAGARAMPLLPKPVLRTTGKWMSAAGQHGKFPAFVTGIHQVGAGNPLGIATMMLPGGLKKTGDVFQRLGREAGTTAATSTSRFLKIRQDFATGAQSHADLLSDLANEQDTLVTRHQRAVATENTEDLAAIEKEQTQIERLRAKVEKAQKAAEKATTGETPEQADLKRATAGLSPDAAARVEQAMREGTARPRGAVQTTMPSAVRVGRTPPATTNPLSDVLPPPDPDAWTALRTLQAEDPNAAARAEAAIQPRASTLGRADVQEVLQQENRRMTRGISPTGVERREVTAPAPAEMPVPEKPAPKVPIGEVPPSRSRRGEPSGTPGLTVADMEALGIDPRANITGLAPPAVQQLLAARARRQALYRTEGGMDSLMQQALERDLKE